MPQEPQVPVEGQSFQERQLDVPYDTRPKAIRNTALIANQQILDLTEILSKHQQINDGRKAVNEIFDAASNGQDAALQIKDYQTAVNAFQDHMVGSRSDINERYPNLDEATQEELSRITDKKIQSFRAHMAVKQDAQNRADRVAITNDTLRGIEDSSSVEERQQRAATGFNAIDQWERSGQIDSIEAKNMRDEFTSKIRISEAYQLATTHPDKVSQFTPQQLGIGSKLYYQLVHVANGTRESAMRTDALAHEEEVANYEKAARNGQYSDRPDVLGQLRDKRLISEDVYRFALGFTPPNLRAKNRLEEILNQVPWDNPEDLKAFDRTWIQPNTELSHSDHEYLDGRVKNVLNKLGDPQARLADQLHYALKTYGVSVGQDILTNPRYRGPKREQYKALMKLVSDNLEHTKDFDTMSKVFNDAVENINKLFGVGERVIPKDGKPHNENVLNNWRSTLTDPRLHHE